MADLTVPLPCRLLHQRFLKSLLTVMKAFLIVPTFADRKEFWFNWECHLKKPLTGELMMAFSLIKVKLGMRRCQGEFDLNVGVYAS